MQLLLPRGGSLSIAVQGEAAQFSYRIFSKERGNKLHCVLTRQILGHFGVQEFYIC